MLVTPDWCRLMARYNAWQNEGLLQLVPTMPPEELLRDRGAFWGGIIGTLSHVLWADQTWLSRFGSGMRPSDTLVQSASVVTDAETWAKARREADAALIDWAESLSEVDLAGDLSWTSAVTGRVEARPRGFLVTHMFNHQTHHRGQVHAMLTAAGLRPRDTDLFLMPS